MGFIGATEGILITMQEFQGIAANKMTRQILLQGNPEDNLYALIPTVHATLNDRIKPWNIRYVDTEPEIE